VDSARMAAGGPSVPHTFACSRGHREPFLKDVGARGIANRVLRILSQFGPRASGNGSGPVPVAAPRASLCASAPEYYAR
jgi:hypothetical protein